MVNCSFLEFQVLNLLVALDDRISLLAIVLKFYHLLKSLFILVSFVSFKDLYIFFSLIQKKKNVYKEDLLNNLSLKFIQALIYGALQSLSLEELQLNTYRVFF